MEATRADRARIAGAPEATARQSALLTAVKAMGLVAAAGLDVALAVRLIGSIHSVAGVATLVAGSLIGYLLADLSSGTVHWFCDTFFDETTPIIGRRLIQPFRVHHTDPQEITTCGMLEQDASSYMSLIPVLWLVRSWPPVGTAALFARPRSSASRSEPSVPTSSTSGPTRATRRRPCAGCSGGGGSSLPKRTPSTIRATTAATA